VSKLHKPSFLPSFLYLLLLKYGLVVGLSLAWCGINYAHVAWLVARGWVPVGPCARPPFDVYVLFTPISFCYGAYIYGVSCGLVKERSGGHVCMSSNDWLANPRWMLKVYVGVFWFSFPCSLTSPSCDIHNKKKTCVCVTLSTMRHHQKLDWKPDLPMFSNDYWKHMFVDSKLNTKHLNRV
jgi:hypothetical protein